MCSQIVRLASESILSLDLAVVAAYGMASTLFNIFQIESEKPESVYSIVMETIQKIENHWIDNESVIQQIITNYIVLAESQNMHSQLLQTNTFSHLEACLNKYLHNEYIAFGLISTCKGLASSGLIHSIR